MRMEWEAAHTVTEELVEGPPSRRANATLTPCPNGNHLWCIGGEFFSEDGKAYFYNDTFRYTPEKVEWRKFVSPTSPGPRSAHAVVSSPAGGGKLFLFGGEFSSLHQNTFHHYRDFWCFDVSSHQWDRIDTKVMPSARSGHRMAVWKHLIVLFGGFYDPGITTRYLNDLWYFDTQEYKWTQVELRDTESKPSPRSGFSFLPCSEGIILHGGYCKEYSKGKRPIGVMLEDTWLLKITLPLDAAPSSSTPISSAPSKSSNAKASKPAGLVFKWERRKRPSDAYAPSLRSGCTMTLWASKNMGVMFGGVTDEDTSEEGLESMFWADMNGYQLTGKGRWNSLTLKKPKLKGAAKKIKKKQKPKSKDSEDDSQDEEADEVRVDADKTTTLVSQKVVTPGTEAGVEDPFLTIPMARYNTMLAILKNTLYLYGGIFERGSREYTLDDFYSIQLDKLDRFVCLKKSDVVIPEGEVESSSSSSDDEEDEDDDSEGSDEDEEQSSENENDQKDQEVTQSTIEGETGLLIPKATKKKAPVEADSLNTVEGVEEDTSNDLRSQATRFMGVSKDTTRSVEDMQSTPLPGETLAMFYSRSREYWAQMAIESENKGKELRKAGFALAEQRYTEYKPILEEVEKILRESGLDQEDMKAAAAAGPVGPGGTSRNRR
ncbi:hypothetical protein CPB83DRAFT_787413 [Crepidotus variabilis]|uniref:DUF4110 domain-containing protein n=1 Tax=Crepidotus variabilis TaxID=179855 RepID=A0A9P6EL62_9AGAR|nr:hypothetical protein CPB83DRAFT_787413 [Crepidotus variabilis]